MPPLDNPRAEAGAFAQGARHTRLGEAFQVSARRSWPLILQHGFPDGKAATAQLGMGETASGKGLHFADALHAGAGPRGDEDGLKKGLAHVAARGLYRLKGHLLPGIGCAVISFISNV